MPKPNNVAVCIDSSLFLAEVFDNGTQLSRVGVIDRFYKTFQFKKFMSETVKIETKKRFLVVTSIVDDISRDFDKSFRVFKGIKPTMDLSDLKFIQSFFSNLKKNYPVRSTEREIINNMEFALVQLLTEKHNRKNPQKTSDFILDFMMGFNRISSSLKYNFYTKLREYKIFSETVNVETCKKLQNEPRLEKTTRKKPMDVQILCEVEAHQRNSGKTCFLATVDQHDFLDNAELVESLIGIKCVDPLYLPIEFEY